MVATPASGVYRLLVRAEGWSLHDERFTRQELRTLAVWRRGGVRPPPQHRPQGLDLCGLVTCLLDDKGLVQLAHERGIDVERLRRCMERHCR